DYFQEAGSLRMANSASSQAGYVLIEFGVYEEAERVLKGVLANCERLGMQQLSAMTRHNLGLVLAQRGDLGTALALETEAAEVFQRQGNQIMEAASRIYLAQILIYAGDLVRAEEEATAAVVLMEQKPRMRAYAWAMQAQVFLAQGQPHL